MAEKSKTQPQHNKRQEVNFDKKKKKKTPWNLWKKKRNSVILQKKYYSNDLKPHRGQITKGHSETSHSSQKYQKLFLGNSPSTQLVSL